MNNGEIFTVDHVTMLLPLVGNLVDMVHEDEQVTARIVEVNHEGVKLKVIPKETKN